MAAAEITILTGRRPLAATVGLRALTTPTLTGMPETQSADPEAIRATRRPHLLPTTPRRALVFALVIAAVSGLAALGLHLRQPTAFRETDGWAAGVENRDLDDPLYVGMSYADDDAEGTITIRSARAHVVENSADADITFYVCALAPLTGIGAIGSSNEQDMRELCDSLVPADGATLRLDAQPMQQVVMAVTLRQPGRVRVDGMDLEYTLGWQAGTQRIGGEVLVGHHG